MHDVLGIGFRKIAERITSEGIEISKDKAHRLYHKYRLVQKANTEQEIEDEETKCLDENIKERTQNVNLARTKDEKRRKIAALMVQKAEVSFDHRRTLFEDKASLLDFAQQTLPFINPAPWLRLTDFCNNQKVGLEDALEDAIGSQADYEEARRDYNQENRDYFLDEHLCTCIDDWLMQQGEELEEEAEDSADDEPKVTIHVVEAPKEYVSIPLSRSTYEWVDSQGFFHISIPRDEEYVTISLGPVEYEETDQ